MTIYRLHSIVEFYPHDTRYFRDKTRAEAEAVHEAEVFAVMYRTEMQRHDVNRFGIVAVWTSPHQPGHACYEIRLEEGTVED